jgi:phospholipid/cholesterol/gamma-HCH transport system permease protein
MADFSSVSSRRLPDGLRENESLGRRIIKAQKPDRDREVMDLFFDRMGRYTILFFIHLARFSALAVDTLRAMGRLSSHLKLTFAQMMQIGVRSLPIVAFTAAFMGMVTSVQAVYQFQSYVPIYLVGSVVSKSLVLELGPVLTSLVLSGRVGASIAAELGTMKVTEQIDALESLAIDPIAYLVMPRVVAGMVMLPVLTIFADAIGILGGLLVSVVTLDITSFDFIKGMKIYFIPWDVFYGLIKAFIFGGAMTLIACYQGINARGGAEGVGRATTYAVVASCLAIFLLNYVLASLLL